MTNLFYTPVQETQSMKGKAFNPWHRSRSPKVRAIIDEAIMMLENYENCFSMRKRKRRPADQLIFCETTEAVLCELMCHHLKGSTHDVYISRSKKTLGKKTRYNSPVFGNKLPAVLDMMASPEMAYINQDLGHLGDRGYCGETGPSMRTSITAGERLIDRLEEHGVTLDDFQTISHRETIVLKRAKDGFWDGGEAVEYTDTATTRRYRKDVQCINSWLSEADIDFDPAAIDGNQPIVDLHDRSLRRVFSQGRFSSGGRLFGGFFQSMNKQHRIDGLLIDGEEVIELDYGQMTPRIVYGMCNTQPTQDDLYAIPGYEYHRSGIKKVMNAMMFSSTPLTRMPQGVRKQFTDRHTIGDVCGAIVQSHSTIQRHFYTGVGHDAQFIESQILIDVMLKLKDKGIVALPIHDAVIVGQSHKDEVMKVMLDSFLAHSGVTGVVTVDGDRQDNTILSPATSVAA